MLSTLALLGASFPYHFSRSDGSPLTNAATMTVFPIVPDWEKYPQWGRDLTYTVGEAGLAGHWIKIVLHYMFIHKAKGYPFWWLLPE